MGTDDADRVLRPTVAIHDNERRRWSAQRRHAPRAVASLAHRCCSCRPRS